MTDQAHLARLALQIERVLVAQRGLRELVIDAGATVAGYRRDVRTLKARMARTRRGRRQRR